MVGCTGRAFRLAVAVLASSALLASGCGSSRPEPAPWANAWSDERGAVLRLEFRYLLPTRAPDCQSDTVTVTGPPLPAPLQLACASTTGAAFSGTLGAVPGGTVLPWTFSFTATIGGMTRSSVVTVDCILQPLAALSPAPGATVSSLVTFTWPKLAGASFEYDVTVVLAGSEVVAFTRKAVDAGSMQATLPPGSYQWTLDATPVGLYDGTSALKCRSSAGQGGFTVR